MGQNDDWRDDAEAQALIDAIQGNSPAMGRSAASTETVRTYCVVCQEHHMRPVAVAINDLCPLDQERKGNAKMANGLVTEARRYYHRADGLREHRTPVTNHLGRSVASPEPTEVAPPKPPVGASGQSTGSVG